MGTSYTKKPGQKRCASGYKVAGGGKTCETNKKSKAYQVKSGEFQYRNPVDKKCKPGFKKAGKGAGRGMCNRKPK